MLADKRARSLYLTYIDVVLQLTISTSPALSSAMSSHSQYTPNSEIQNLKSRIRALENIVLDSHCTDSNKTGIDARVRYVEASCGTMIRDKSKNECETDDLKNESQKLKAHLAAHELSTREAFTKLRTALGAHKADVNDCRRWFREKHGNDIEELKTTLESPRLNVDYLRSCLDSEDVFVRDV